MNNCISFVFLVATSYSGSTLLSMLMNAHPQIASIGELDNSIGLLFKSGKFNKYDCSCGVDIKKCEFWKEVKNRCYGKNIELDLYDFKTRLDCKLGNNINRVLFGVPGKYAFMQKLRDSILWQIPHYKKMIDSAMHRQLGIAQAVLEVTSKKIFFDASKNIFRAFFLSKSSKVDFKLLHLVRDPRGVMNSYIKRKEDISLREIARSWMRINLAAMRLKASLPNDAYLLVHYEQLCKHPEDKLAEISCFIGVEPLDLMGRVNGQTNHIIGNEMRLRSFNGIKLDESWRQNLMPKQLEECMRITSNVCQTLGYE